MPPAFVACMRHKCGEQWHALPACRCWQGEPEWEQEAENLLDVRAVHAGGRLPARGACGWPGGCRWLAAARAERARLARLRPAAVAAAAPAAEAPSGPVYTQAFEQAGSPTSVCLIEYLTCSPPFVLLFLSPWCRLWSSPACRASRSLRSWWRCAQAGRAGYLLVTILVLPLYYLCTTNSVCMLEALLATSYWNQSVCVLEACCPACPQSLRPATAPTMG